MGERIERYRNAAEARARVDASKAQRLPCDFVGTKNSRWRTEPLTAPAIGDDPRLALVRSLDRTDSYNYEFATTADSVWFGLVLNVRHPDEAELRRLIAVTWAKARQTDVVRD